MHRSAAIIFAFFTLFALVNVGYAQIPSGNVYLGYSYMSADLLSSGRTNMNGWNGSLEGKVLPFIGIVADFSGKRRGFPTRIRRLLTRSAAALTIT